MGMYDSFYFAKGVLPDNEESDEHEFQTKSLECNLDVYRVDGYGFVKKYNTNCGQETRENLQVNEGAYVYSYSGGPGMKKHYQEYKILIHNNKIIYVDKVADRREV